VGRVLGDLETPVAAYLKLVGDGDGFLPVGPTCRALEAVQLLGHDPVATLELRDGLIEIKGQHLSADIPLDQGMLAALDAIIAAYRAPIIPDLPPLQGGVMGYLGYDTIREVEHLPHVPHDDRGFPDAVMSIIGSLAAFDHWRQRVYLIESVPGLDEHEISSRVRPSLRAMQRRRQAVTAISSPQPSRRSSARLRQKCGSGRWRVPTGCRVAKASSPATSSRSCSLSATHRSGPTVRLLSGAAPGEPQPVHVLPSSPRHHDCGQFTGADGQGARAHGGQPPDRRHPSPRSYR
jgi:hypothetical protein